MCNGSIILLKNCYCYQSIQLYFTDQIDFCESVKCKSEHCVKLSRNSAHSTKLCTFCYYASINICTTSGRLKTLFS